MRLVISFVLLFCFVTTAQAQEKPEAPKPKVGEKEKVATKGFWIGSAAMAGSSVAPVWGGNTCRKNNGVEPCTAHYGAYEATNGVIIGFNTIVWPSVFYACRKWNHNSKACWFIPAAVVGFNVGYGAHEATIHKREH